MNARDVGRSLAGASVGESVASPGCACAAAELGFAGTGTICAMMRNSAKKTFVNG